MNIGYDAKRAFYNLSGLGNYSRSLISAIHKFYPEEKLFLFTPHNPAVILSDSEESLHRGKDASFLSMTGKGNNIKIISPKDFIGKAFPSFWRSSWMKKDIERNGIQIYHGLSNELPAGISNCKFQIPNFKSVVTIHDLIFKRYPEYYPVIDRNIYDYKFRKSCVAADKIIAISEQTKRDIIDFYKIAPEKIEVIYQSSGDYLRKDIGKEEIGQTKKKYQLPDEYILSVGTIEERKNLLLVLKALSSLKLKQSIPLVVVGKPTAYKQKLISFLMKEKMMNNVFFLDTVSTEDLQPIYAGAKLFVYPSRFEGFGIPIIEAMHYGIPVIAAKGSCLEEAGGPSTKYVSPDDENEMASAIENILANNSVQEKMKTEGKDFVKKFDAEKFAHQTMQCYQSLL